MHINYFYIIILFLILITQNFYHNYEFVKFNNWINLIDSKQIYLINDKNYCVISNKGIIYNNYICTQNVIPIMNYLNTTSYNINQITPIKHEKNNNSIFKWFIYIFGFYFIISFIYNLILYNIKNQQNIKNNQQDLNNSNNSTSSFFDSFYGGGLLNGMGTNFEVKSNKDPTITIDNFIGCNNIKKEINKVINQINFNNIYKNNGCELPKGLLLIGNPGCGKTHLVKTIINATGMNYIFTTGSDLNKFLVGSGSNAIGQIFNKARSNKPCLIFFDEADTILKKRTHTEGSSSSTEFGSTICKLLSEMDSLKTESGVIVVFATNMDIEHIDKGVMRAGRIDQIIHINNPTFEERIDLFKMYLGNLLHEERIDLNKISKLSYGLTGSDIKKIVNSIKINKVHKYIEENPDKIENLKVLTNDILKCNEKIPIEINTSEIDNEISKCILGLERERKINQINKKIIAYHEAGHAIMSYLIKDSIIPSKICISINSKSLGYTLFPQEDDDLLLKTSIKQLLIEVMILYAGRASEKIFIGEITCGAEDDYMKARRILKRLLMHGMLIPEYNFIENSTKDDKIPEHIEKQLININKIILTEVENLLKSSDIIVQKTAEKIIEFGSIISDDIDEIFKFEFKQDLIGSYDINKIYNLITESNS